MWLLCVWAPSLREFMSSSMRWRSGLIASVLIGNSCLRLGSRHLDLQDRAPRPLLTISPPITALAVGLPAQRAIAQRFCALAHRFRSRHCKITADVGGTTDMSRT